MLKLVGADERHKTFSVDLFILFQNLTIITHYQHYAQNKQATALTKR